MKTISIRELHERTGQWVRQVSRFGGILVTDRGKTIARLTAETPRQDIPYFARRILRLDFRKLAASGKLAGGIDSTAAISDEREDRGT